MANIPDIIKQMEKLKKNLDDYCDKKEVCSQCPFNRSPRVVNKECDCFVTEFAAEIESYIPYFKRIMTHYSVEDLKPDDVCSQPQVDTIIEGSTGNRPPQPQSHDVLSEGEIKSLLKALTDSEYDVVDDIDDEAEETLLNDMRIAEEDNHPMDSERSEVVHNEAVHHPNHYVQGRQYEPYKVIYDWRLNFNLGNAVKYLSRAGRKDPLAKVEDLCKAKQYIDFEIELQEKGGK